MSDDQKENPEKPRVRKIVRSASSAERPTFEAAVEGAAPAAPAPGAEGEASSQRKWDVRADRKPGDAPRPPPRQRRPPRGPRPGGAPGGEAAAAGGEPGAAGAGDAGARRPFGGRPRRPVLDDGLPRRPGVSGGRAMPEYRRGPLDRSSAEFVDKWLNLPPRKPDEPRPERKPRERRERREGPDQSKPGIAQARPAQAARRPEPPPPPPAKLPTLHETIMVGLPRVSLEEQRERAAKPKTAKEALAAKTAAAPAKPKAAEPAKGEVIVDTGAIGVDQAGAVAALKAAGAAGEALVDAWMKAQNLGAIVETGTSEDITGNARKAARRALSVLRSKGATLPERLKPATSVLVEEEIIEATFTPPDGRGTVSVTIAKRRGGERAHIAEVILREGTGVVNAVSGWMSRSQIKEAHQRIADATGVAPATVPVEWVRHLVEVALKDNAKSGQLVPIGLERCKELLARDSSEEPKHPLADLEAALEGDAAAPASLHGEPEFRGWVPDPRAIDEVIRAVGQRLNPADAEDAKKVDEVVRDEVKLATDRYFTPEQRAILARRMRDVAITVRGRAGDDKAREVLRAAKAIEGAGLITSPPSDLEFLRTFVQKGIAMAAQQQGGQLRVPVPNKPA